MSVAAANLVQRHREPELMDQPDLDPRQHDSALASLSRLNAWAGSADIVWPEIQRCASALGRPCRVLDVATGAGDLPLALRRRAGKAGIDIDFTAMDISPRAIEHARRRAEANEARIDWRCGDALRGEWPDKPFDVVMCSLFLHHLEHDEAIVLLRRMYSAAERVAVVSDLRRCTAGLWLTMAASVLLTRSPIVRVDGVRSVRAAFTPDEALALAQSAGWSAPEVQPAWPFRFLLIGRKE